MFKRLSQYLGSTKSQKRKRIRECMNIESLEKRELFVVGANFLAPVVTAGSGFDGVVRVFMPAGSCSGTLLSTGRHVLTAAHCVDFDVDANSDGNNDSGNGSVDTGNYQIVFDMPGRTVTMAGIQPSEISLPTAWTGNWRRDDIAIIELPRLAPVDAERFDIYRNNREIGTVGTLVGYGNSGQGTAQPGQPAGHVADNTKRTGRNTIDSTNNSRLRIDLDNPGIWRESISAPGDSGGPLFLGSQIVGVSSSTTLQSQFNAAGVRNYTGNAFGTWSEYTRVADYQDWIDSVLSERYTLTIDLDDHPVGNDGRGDGIDFSLNSDMNVEIRVNGTLYHSDHFSQTRSIDFLGSDDDESYRINSLDLWETIDIHGGRGTDSLFGYSSNYVNNWTIDGNDSGSLSNGLQTIDFESIEVLRGGSRNDNFRFKGWARLSGAILGGDGTDVLDFSGSNRSVDVNLEQLRANSVASGLTNRIGQIENVIGSRFSDTIVGDSGVNKIWGGDGNDQLYGGAGADYLYGGNGDDELYGQSGVDTLYGQADNDLLDGGWDSAVDQLYGGTGVDTFIEDNRRLGDFYTFNEERVRDATGEDIRRRRVYSKYS